MRSGRERPGESEAPPVQFSALHYKLPEVNFPFPTFRNARGGNPLTPLATVHGSDPRLQEPRAQAEVCDTKTRLTSSGGQRWLRGAGFIDDRRADQVAPLGPGAVIVADLVEAEEVLENEPGVRTALADAAVGDNFVFAGDA